eukprot:SAG11_NODE_16578_length_543_cov_2.774775_1_plen_100_part_10
MGRGGAGAPLLQTALEELRLAELALQRIPLRRRRTGHGLARSSLGPANPSKPPKPRGWPRGRAHLQPQALGQALGARAERSRVPVREQRRLLRLLRTRSL